MREANGYREELEGLLDFTNGRHMITILELAEYDYGKPETRERGYKNAEKVRRHYKIGKGIRQLPIGEVARRRINNA